MNLLGKAIVKDGRLVLNNPVTLLIDPGSLKDFTGSRSQVMNLYKRFFRLRNMVDSKIYHRDTYQRIIRRRFTRDDFQVRRKVVLGAEQPLTSTEYGNRILNTLAFVFNSTVEPDDETSSTSKKPALYFKDLERPQRFEKRIFQTIMRMDQQKPDSLKYDRHYSWFREVEEAYKNIPDQPSTKAYRSYFLNFDPSLIGFRDYELTVMLLNEQLGLCL